MARNKKRQQNVFQGKEINRTSKSSLKKKAKSKNLKQVGEMLREEVENINTSFRNFHEEMVSAKAKSADKIDLKKSESKKQELKTITDEDVVDFTEKLMGL